MPEYLPHLFESFSRERNSSESGIIGTGLGLPIVKSLVDMMDGTIRVDSGLGKGTRFEIILCHKIAEEKTILEDIKMKVEVATEGEVALKCIKRVPADYYDLVLMDIQMPLMDGYEATRQIRALNTEIASIPIIAMTANAFDEDKEKALATGMNGHLAKPINICLLKKAIAKALL